MTHDETRAGGPTVESEPSGRAARTQGRGCMVAGLGMAVLVLTPAVGAWVYIPQPVGIGLFLLGVAALVGGAGLGMLGAAREPPRTEDGGSPGS